MKTWDEDSVDDVARVVSQMPVMLSKIVVRNMERTIQKFVLQSYTWSVIKGPLIYI